jgi:hypothetical protein
LFHVNPEKVQAAGHASGDVGATNGTATRKSAALPFSRVTRKLHGSGLYADETTVAANPDVGCAALVLHAGAVAPRPIWGKA